MTSVATATMLRRASARRPRLDVLRQLVTMGGLLLADVLAFVSGYYLFRHGHQMPMILLPSARGRPDFAAAADVYAIMGAVFIAVRYILGDYGRRQLFWDSARLTTGTLPLVALPDVLLVFVTGSHNLYTPLILSWLSFAALAMTQARFPRCSMT